MATPVSVIIPCYNQGRFLAEAIQSALDQDYPDKEVIVVNDGSPDETRTVAQAFGEKIVYQEQANRGLAAARNAGIRVVRGTYIALLDSDDVLLPGSLSVRAHYLETHPEVALVCGDALLFDGAGTHGLKSDWSGEPRHPANFRWDTVEYCATPSTVMLRRSCFDRVGGFDEGLRTAGEDWLFLVQLSCYYNLVYLNQPLIRYRIHSQNATRDVGQVNTQNRYAVAQVVEAPNFGEYPAHFRAKLLFYRFATAWHVEPKSSALRFFVRAVATDPSQLPYGLRVIRQGLTNTLKRRRLT